LLYRFLVEQQEAQEAQEVQEAGKATFGEALREALFRAGRSQTWLANKLITNPSQVSRWVRSRQVPHIDTVHRIEELLGADLHDAFRHSLRVPEPGLVHQLFVSAPISGLNPNELESHRREVARVVDAAKKIVGEDKVYWLGVEVKSLYDLGAANFVAEANLNAFDKCRTYLYLQFAEMDNPSGALVEVGFALGRKLKTTMIIKKGLRTPYMFGGFEGVAAKLHFLPDVFIYEVETIGQAVRLIETNGRQLLLPD
jgi:transcriptional regulator with XRE-family HTH domain